MKAETQIKWIKVSDQLPPDRLLVLIQGPFSSHCWTEEKAFWKRCWENEIYWFESENQYENGEWLAKDFEVEQWRYIESRNAD